MRILLVNHYAGHPKLGMEYRPFFMAKEWQKQGHQVEIVGCSQSHVRQEQPQFKGWRSTENIDGIPFTWLKSTSYQGNGVRRLINIFIFLTQFFLYGRFRLKDRPDIIIASSTYPLDIYVCKYLARHFKARLIFEAHDLWPLSPIEIGGISPKHPFMRLLQHAENFAYAKSDAVISMLPCTLEHMKNHGLKPEKFYYVPNGVFPDRWDSSVMPPEPHQKLIAKLKSEQKFLVAYAGAHGAANDLSSFIDCAPIIDKNVALILIGQGPEKEQLQKRVQDLNLKNVHFLPAVPKDQIPYLLDKMDALYIGLSPQPLFRFGVSPNKLMDYMMAAKPIIYAIESGNHPVIDFNCGLETSPGQPSKIAKTIDDIFNMPEEKLNTLGNNGRVQVETHFSYYNLAKQYLEILSSL